MQWASPSTWLAMYLLSGPVQSILRSKLVQKGSDVVVDAIFQLPGTVVGLLRRRRVWTSSETLWCTIEHDMHASAAFLRSKIQRAQEQPMDDGFEVLTMESGWTEFAKSALEQYDVYLNAKTNMDRNDPNNVQTAVLVLEQLHRAITTLTRP